MKSNFVNNHLSIGSEQPVHKSRLCNKCEEMRLPEGGVQMNPSRWICASCWTNRVTGRNLKQVKKKDEKND
jgi:formylmethanofuran dehydrogenase subunit E